MDRAQNLEELMDRFVRHSDTDSVSLNEIGVWLQGIRVALETQGRMYEIKEMIKYHTKAAQLSPTEEEKNTHLASIMVLEGRLGFLEQPRETPPITLED